MGVAEIMLKNCIKCGVELTATNIYPSHLRISWYICNSCDKRIKEAARHNPVVRERRRKLKQQWRTTKKGRESRKLEKAQKRNLRWTKLFENPFNEPVEWHHVSDELVVAVPKEIHQLYYGYKNHRELCMNVVNQIYM